MVTKKMLIFFIIGLCCLTMYSCAQQRSIPKLCKNAMSVDDAKDNVDDGDNILITDTLTKEVKVIFEQGVDDSVYVFIKEISVQEKNKNTPIFRNFFG